MKMKFFLYLDLVIITLLIILKNMRRYFVYIFCIFLLFPIVLTAQEKPLQDVAGFKAKLKQMSQKTTSIESDFIQEKNLSILSENIVSKGKFWYKKENNIRWEYLQPYKYLIIISGSQMFVKDDRNQKQYDIESNRMFQEMSNFISGCIQGEILNNTKDFKIEYFENENFFLVKLSPYSEKMKQMLSGVQIWFDKKDLSVSSLMMTEPGEDYTKIDFINKKLNVEIPVQKFSFN